MRGFARRWKYSITFLAACIAIGTWAIVSGHVYHGHVSWWRFTIAALAVATGTALNHWEAGPKR